MTQQLLRVDIIIVGAGPVGLMLANQLQRRNVNYRLLEARSQREAGRKALGVTPRTLEILDQMGLLDEALDKGMFITAVNTVVEGQQVARLELDASASPYGALGLNQFHAEEILEADLRRRGGRIEWGTSLTSLHRMYASVEVELSGPGGPESSSCRWLVGCDGAHSAVRTALDSPFEGEENHDQTFLLGDVGIDWSHSHREVWNMTQRSEDGQVPNVVRVVPIAGQQGRYRMSLSVPPELIGGDPWQLLRDLAAPALPPGARLQDLRWSTFYGIGQRRAPSYRVGRVFLAGDAAHVHHPSSGLGLNTGLQDAYNLGWKLASVVRGEALDSLLDSYHSERYPLGQLAREAEAEEWADSQLAIHYRGGPLAFGQIPPGDRGAQPGDRVDFVEGLQRPYLQRQGRLIELLRNGEFHLFGYGGEWRELALLIEKLRPHFGSELRAWAVLAPGQTVEGLPEEVPYLLDGLGRARVAWGAGPGAMLVRPDGHVGWRGRPLFDEALSRLLTQLSLNYG